MHSFRLLLAGLGGLLCACLLARPALAQTVTSCYPTFSSGCTDGDGLNRFVFNGLELSRNTGCTPNQTYQFPVASVQAGQTYPFSGTLLSSSYLEGVTMWIDADRNGTFEPGEQVFQTPTMVVGTFSGNLTIPTTVMTNFGGRFILRVLVRYSAVPTNPCGSYTYGEVEDYTLDIAAGSCAAPTGLVAQTAAIAPGDYAPSTTVSWNPVSGIGSYEVNWATFVPYSNVASSTIVSASSARLLSLQYDKTYTIQVRSNCSSSGTGFSSAYTSFTFNSLSSCPSSLPTSLGAGNITNSSALLYWTNTYTANDVGFEVRYRIRNSNGPWTVARGRSYYAVGTYAYNLSLTQLASATQYEWQARNACGIDQGEFTVWSGLAYFTTTGTACPAPTGLNVTFPTSGTGASSPTYAATWNGVAGAASYNVVETVIQYPDYPFSVTGLTSPSYSTIYYGVSTAYMLQVRAVCSTGNLSPYTSVTFLSPTACATLPPYSLSTTGVANTSAALNWTSQSRYVGGYSDPQYDIQWRVQGSATWTNIFSSTVTGFNLFPPYSLTGLQPGTAYQWQIRSKCRQDGSYSDWIGPVSFTTTGGICNVPTGLSVSFPAATTNTNSLPYGFSWNSTPGVSTYNLLLTAIGSSIPPISATGLNTSTYSSTLLYSGTPYLLQVQSRCTNGSVSAYASISFTTPVACPAPYLPQSRSVTSSSAVLYWEFPYTNPALAGSTFLVFWRVRGNTVWNQRAGITNYPYALTGLSPSTVYEWQVSTQCPSSNQSVFSEILSFTTTAIATPCNAPASITTSTPAPSSNIASSYTTLIGWGTVSGAISYDVFVEDMTSTNPTFITYGLTQTALMVSVLGDLTYRLRVRANCNNGQSGFTSTTLVVPTQCNLYAPVRLTTTAVNSNSAQVSFGINSNAYYSIDSYEIQWRVIGITTWSNSLTIASSDFGPGGPASMTGLLPSTAYEWQVRSRCKTGRVSLFSGPGSFTTSGNVATGPSAMEYFFDTDPGYGNATPVAGFTLTAVATPFTFQVPMPSNISDGIHFIHLRAKDVSGNWSVVGIRPFFKDTYPTIPPAPTGRMEYFVDNDPGYGLATAITGYTSGPAQTNFSFTIPVPNNLPDGIHFLHLRVQDGADKWSVVGIRSFFKDTYPAQSLPAITRIEYFVDTDPGFGSGSALTGFGSGTLVNNFSTPIQLTGLTSTTHTIYIRAQDTNGQWSLLGARPFTFDGTVVICTSMYTLKDGDWTDPTVWSCGRIPTATDAVQVKHRIQLPVGSMGTAKQIGLDVGARVIYGIGSRIKLGF